jgi:hypothetical protein
MKHLHIRRQLPAADTLQQERVLQIRSGPGREPRHANAARDVSELQY